MNHRFKLFTLLIGLLFILIACTSPVTEPETPGDAQTPAGETVIDIKITGDGVDLTFDQDVYRTLEEQVLTTTNVSSSGEVAEIEISGILLFPYLEANGVDVDKIVAINLIADDGYRTTVEQEMWEGSDMMIITTINGESLEMARSALPGKRSMYWVKNLAEIQIAVGEKQDEKSEVNTVLVMRELIREMDAQRLNNQGFEVDAYSLQTLFEKHGHVPTRPVKLIAQDGLEKTETLDVFLAQYITFEFEEEDNTPLYFSEEISDGMRVKFLELVIADDQALFLGNEIGLKELFEAVGMRQAEAYRLSAIDGFSVEVPADAIEFGKIYLDDSERLRTKFEGYDLSDVEGKGSVKNICSIEAVGESTTESQSSRVPLLKVFVGDERTLISKEDFMALPQIEKKLTRVNSKGQLTEGVYVGVHWSEIARAVGIDPDTSVTLVASDGYEVMLTSDVLNDPDSLFAITQDGEPIKSDGDGKTWFCASENFTANHWAKYIVKIVIDQ